ncbi:DUF6476 family protein [Pukyongiella litopenaei]|uniref:Uncharacterized protein n=1 Tax=Pukyongiella litopenaei TaxID=2605946 RepID=A0A2S0MKP8_9RHOB|nr:DUF6476 family protein [Pukyongiella litopenaei]AVO36432.1 hypothetical protein C6Y53_01055 [Pukyongiella litopenaei]
MDDPSEPMQEPANLRFLRRLVTVLTAVMIGGLLVIIGLLVIRFSGENNPALPLPDHIALPDGTRATAFTTGGDWYAVVTADDRILIFDRASGSQRQEIRIVTGD